MSIRIVRLGSPRSHEEGLRIGTVRRPPRGIKKADIAKLNYYDVWYPILAPSEPLLKAHFPIEDDASWSRFRRGFLKEMKESGPAKTLDLLVALSHQTDFSIGCYCANEQYCHRSLLRELMLARGANVL